MKNFLSRIWQLDLLRSKLSASYIEIAEVITNLRNSGTEILIQFQDDNFPSACVISAFSPDYSVVVIDTLNPPDSFLSLTPGKKTKLIAKQNGQQITLISQFVETFLPNDITRYQLKILSCQRIKRTELTI